MTIIKSEINPTSFGMFYHAGNQSEIAPKSGKLKGNQKKVYQENLWTNKLTQALDISGLSAVIHYNVHLPSTREDSDKLYNELLNSIQSTLKHFKYEPINTNFINTVDLKKSIDTKIDSLKKEIIQFKLNPNSYTNTNILSNLNSNLLEIKKLYNKLLVETNNTKSSNLQFSQLDQCINIIKARLSYLNSLDKKHTQSNLQDIIKSISNFMKLNPVFKANIKQGVKQLLNYVSKNKKIDESANKLIDSLSASINTHISNLDSILSTDDVTSSTPENIKKEKDSYSNLLNSISSFKLSNIEHQKNEFIESIELTLAQYDINTKASNINVNGSIIHNLIGAKNSDEFFEKFILKDKGVIARSLNKILTTEPFTKRKFAYYFKQNYAGKLVGLSTAQNNQGLQTSLNHLADMLKIGQDSTHKFDYTPILLGRFAQDKLTSNLNIQKSNTNIDLEDRVYKLNDEDDITPLTKLTNSLIVGNLKDNRQTSMVIFTASTVEDFDTAIKLQQQDLNVICIFNDINKLTKSESVRNKLNEVAQKIPVIHTQNNQGYNKVLGDLLNELNKSAPKYHYGDMQIGSRQLTVTKDAILSLLSDKFKNQEIKNVISSHDYHENLASWEDEDYKGSKASLDRVKYQGKDKSFKHYQIIVSRGSESSSPKRMEMFGASLDGAHGCDYGAKTAEEFLIATKKLKADIDLKKPDQKKSTLVIHSGDSVHDDFRGLVSDLTKNNIVSIGLLNKSNIEHKTVTKELDRFKNEKYPMVYVEKMNSFGNFGALILECVDEHNKEVKQNSIAENSLKNKKEAMKTVNKFDALSIS